MTDDRALFGFIRPAPPGPRRRAELRCRVLEVMAASVSRDVPLGPVIAAAAQEQRGFARRAAAELRDLLDAGVRLPAALGSCRLFAFPEHTVAAVEAADGTPRLASVLASAAADDAEVENRRASVWAAAFYPLLVVAIVGGVAGGVIGPTRGRLTEIVEAMELAPPPEFGVAAGAGRVAGWIAIGAAEVLVAVWLVRRLPWLTMGLGGALRCVWQATPGVRGAARLGGAARMLRALEPCVRGAMPLHVALGEAAGAAGCRDVTRSALDAAALAEGGAPADDVAAALLVPAAIRARFALAASHAPERFADAVRALADDCTERYRDALDARMRWFQPVVTVLVGALVLTQLLGIFAMLASVRHAVPSW